MDTQLITLCQELIQRPSLSGQEEAVAQFLRQTMEELGFDRVEVDAYGSVMGAFRGSRPGPTVLMDGHIDTVDLSDPDAWTHDPFGGELQDGKIYGRGASDMKGSVAAMVLAAARFAETTGRDFAGTVWVSGSVHEECFEGVSCRSISQITRPDCVIIGEATSATLKRGQRGRAEIVVETRGKTCHSSNPEAGHNAVYVMAAVIPAIQALTPNVHPVLGKGILELTDIISSPWPGASVVPGLCRATFDRRLLVGETEESVLAQVEQALAQVKARLPQLDARAYLARGEAPCWTGETIRAKRFFPAWLLEEDHPLVQKALSGLQSAGLEPKLSHFSFCTNGSHFCGEAGIPTVGFGPSLERLAHVIDEYIEVEQLELACRGFQGILSALLTG